MLKSERPKSEDPRLLCSRRGGPEGRGPAIGAGRGRIRPSPQPSSGLGPGSAGGEGGLRLKPGEAGVLVWEADTA